MMKKDGKKKRVIHEKGKIASAIRISKAVKEKPSEEVVERFKRKAYQRKE